MDVRVSLDENLRASNALTTSIFPVWVAIMSGVSPLNSVELGFAPAFKSRSTIVRLRFSAAWAKGVTP